MNDLLSIAVSNAVVAAVLALAAIAVGAVYRRPALMHGLWLLVLLKLATPPLLVIPVAWPTAAETPYTEPAPVREEPEIVSLPNLEKEAAPAIAPLVVETEPAGVELASSLLETAAPSPPPTQYSVWPQVLRTLWLVGTLAWFLLALGRLYRFHHLLRFAGPAPSELQKRARRLAHSLGLKRSPSVWLLPGRIAPMLWSIGGSPRLLVPAELLDMVSDEQLDTLLVHELAHFRRRDHWVRVLEFVVMGLYWWHPVVWLARRELHEAEEQCCDAWVVSTLPGTGRTYASALLETVDFLSSAQAALPPLASGLGQIADLKRRLTMILQGTTPRSLTWPGSLAVLVLGLTFLPMLPSLHGQTPSKEEARKSVDEAEKALREAQAALELHQAALAQKMAELRRAEERLRAESGRRDRQEAGNHYRYTIVADSERVSQVHVVGDGAKATYRIEITLPADESVKPNEIIEKIRKALPKELHSKIVIGPVEVHSVPIGRSGQQQALPPRTVAPARIATPSIEYRLAPPTAISRSPSITPPAVEFNKTHESKSSEKRINDLEKKLEKVLQELHELRKEMKQPQAGAPTPLPAPAAQPGNAIPDLPPLPQPGQEVPQPPSPAPAVAPAAPAGPTPPTPPVAPAPPRPAE